MKEIPTDCVLNKGITGCGATTLAIQQLGHTIIAVPFVGLIQNKVEQHKGELLGIYGTGGKGEVIRKYIASHPTIKIMTTYDSLPKVCSELVKLGLQPYEDIPLVVDEWHILFQAYLFRNNAIKNLLHEAKQFSRVTFISATPIERQY